MPGSFFVCKAKAERFLHFDHGIEGSIAEDCYFAMNAYKNGYTFDWIEGEMWEKSPFTLWDFIEQRKRWFQGIHLVVHSSTIPWIYKIFVALSYYAWITGMICKPLNIIAFIYSNVTNRVMNILIAFTRSVSYYMHIFGTFKSINYQKLGLKQYVVYILASILSIALAYLMETIAVWYAMLSDKGGFYIVKKSTYEVYK